MSERKYPFYAAMNFGYDATRLTTELLNLQPYFLPLSPQEAALKNQDKYIKLAPDDWYTDCDKFIPSGLRKVFVKGKHKCWWGMNLRKLQEDDGRNNTGAYYGSNTFRGARWNGKWDWNPELNIDYVKELVRRLPLTEVNIVRVMTIPAGGFGPMHVDTNNENPWEQDGEVSISLLPLSGGVPMVIYEGEGKPVHRVDDRAFWFKDSIPHGIEPTKSIRCLLRIHGKSDPESMKKLMSGVELWS